MSEKPAAVRRFQPGNLLGVLSFLGKYPGRVAVSVGLLLVNISIELSLPQILGATITNLRWHAEWGAVFDHWPFVLLFGSLVLSRAGVGYILGPIRNRLIQRTLADIRAAIYDSIQRLPFQYHDKSSAGELISRSTTDISRLQDFFHACVFLSVDIVVSLLVTFGLIFSLSPILGWLTVLTTVPTLGLVAFFAAKLQPQWRKVHDLHSAMTTVVQENIAGVRVVRAFAREHDEIGRFAEKKKVFLGTVMETINYWAARVPMAQFIFGLAMPAALWLGGRQVIRGEMLLGDLAKIVFYLMAVGQRVGMVGQFTNIVQNASASAERVLEIIRAPRALVDGPLELPEGPGEVSFADVSFHYQDGKASLEGVSFTAAARRTYAIVGATGSGKTTLANLIPRFYEPTSGRILFDGVDLRELRLDALRRGVGFIFQETFLFSASIAENIAWGRPGASREEIIRCAEAAQADEFVRALEQGYDTIVGERGITLSGGQKQRIAIARAFLMDPRILILDDATASVDSRTERLIHEGLRRLAKDRTTFIIAHRHSSIQLADEVLVLREGRLVERGAHAELLATGVFYRQIFEDQLAGRKAAGELSFQEAIDLEANEEGA